VEKWFSFSLSLSTSLFRIRAINTPVCDVSLDINGQDWMYCESGNPYGFYSYKRKINRGV